MCPVKLVEQGSQNQVVEFQRNLFELFCEGGTYGGKTFVGITHELSLKEKTKFRKGDDLSFMDDTRTYMIIQRFTEMGKVFTIVK